MGVTQKQKEQEQEEAIRHLREILKPGDKVYGIVRTVSRSGMSRTIDFYTFKPHECECPQTGPGANHEPGCPGDVIDRVYLSGWIAQALDYRRTQDGALKVQGCGMSMIFHVVYHLGYKLFPEGFGIPCHYCQDRPVSREYAALMNSGMHVQISYCPKDSDGHGAHLFYGRNGDRSGWDTDGGYALKAETL